MSIPPIIGHEPQRARLKQLLSAGRLPTSIILSGISGIGKSMVARELLRSLFCETPTTYGGCDVCRSCRLFDVGNLPDFYYVDCLDKETWNIERIRELLYSLNLRIFSGAVRGVLIDHAEHLSLQASNALLKAVEEPRTGTYFCIVTSNAARLPRTLVSRCQLWYFNALTTAQIKEILSFRPDPPSDLDEIAILADGCMDNIDTISGDKESWRHIQKKMEKIFKGDISAAQDLAQILSRGREAIRTKLKLMRIYARQRMRETEDRRRRSRWAVCVSNLLEAERFICERNLNPQYVLISLLLSLVDHPALGTFTTLSNSDTLISRNLEGF